MPMFQDMLLPKLVKPDGVVDSSRVVSVDGTSVVCLLPDEVLPFIGSICVTVLSGCLENLGWVLPVGERHELYSPPWDSCSCLRAAEQNADDQTECRAEVPHLPSNIQAAVNQMAKQYQHSAILQIESIPDMQSCLNEYDASPTPSEQALQAVLQLKGAQIFLDFNSVAATTPKRRKTDACVSLRRPIAIPTQWRDIVVALKRGHAEFSEAQAQALTGAPHERTAAIARQCVAVVAGAKGVGKSTFNKYLVNHLLTHMSRYPLSCDDERTISVASQLCGFLRAQGLPPILPQAMLSQCKKAVAYIDVDPGQPEFTIPSCLSIHLVSKPVHGPAHTHLRAPLLCYCLGDISPKEEPTAYVQRVQSICDFVNAYLRPLGIPIVVNTMGWVRGLGLHALQALLEQLQPTHFIKIEGASASRKFFIKGDGHQEYITHSVCDWRGEQPEYERSDDESAAPNISLPEDGVGATPTHREEISAPATPIAASAVVIRPDTRAVRSAVDLRAYRIVSYFFPRLWHCSDARPARVPVDGSASVAFALQRALPYRVPIARLRIACARLDFAAADVYEVLAGRVVGLCVTAGDDGAHSPAPTGDTPHLTHALDGPCVGFGIIRSVCRERRELFVLSPLPLEAIRCVNSLAVCATDLPACMVYSMSTQPEPFVSTQTCVEAVGSTEMRSRNVMKRKRFE